MVLASRVTELPARCRWREVTNCSRALGTFRPGSDIDLTLKGSLSHRDLLALESELDELMLPYKIDLSLFHQIDNARLVQHIEQVGRVLYEMRRPEAAGKI